MQSEWVSSRCSERVFSGTCAAETLHYASSRSVGREFRRGGFTYQGIAHYRLSPFIGTKCHGIKNLTHRERAWNWAVSARRFKKRNLHELHIGKIWDLKSCMIWFELLAKTRMNPNKPQWNIFCWRNFNWNRNIFKIFCCNRLNSIEEETYTSV